MRGRTAVGALGALAVALAAFTPVAPASAARASAEGPAATAAAQDCERVLPGVRRGDTAVDQLGEALPDAAARAGMSAEKYRRALRQDNTLRVDPCGRTFVVERATPDQADRSIESPSAEQALSTAGDAFALASRPGAPRTIYLDFDGATVSGTAWNDQYLGGAAWQAPAFSADGDAAAFSAAEQAVVKDVWLRVAEDYAPFDVNVTTAVPDPAALARADRSDQVYGATALITNDSVVQGQCRCGGIAYIGVFDSQGAQHEYYQPALVFQKGLGTSGKSIAEATSHELGHNLGLLHDGTASVEYYSGHGSWAPIMGVGYSRPVTQFSAGEYTGANNTQDDFAVMAGNGAVALADDHGDTDASATTLPATTSVDGLISSRTDTDRFRFSAAGATTVTVTPQTVGANLDARLEIRDATGAVVATHDPPVGSVSSSTATGLAATTSFTAVAGTYTATVDGTGWGDPAGPGYSDYASLGRYTILLTTTAPGAVTATTTSVPRGTVGTAYRTTLAAAGGTPPYTWQLASGVLPSGLSIAADGALSGTPTTAGTTTVRFTVTDSAASSATTVPLTLTVDPEPTTPVTVTTASLPGGVIGRSYTVALAATGGTAPYTWSVQSGSLPPGLSLHSDGTLTGAPTAAGTSTVTVRATDTEDASGTRVLSVTVVAPVTVTTTSLPVAYRGTAYSARLNATGGSPPYTWQVTSGSLPAGLQLSSTGAITGRPTTTQGRWFTVRVTDARGLTTSRSLSITVLRPLTVSTAQLPAGVRGAWYAARVTADGGTAPYTWRLTSGVLPTGLRLTSAGVISGSPTTAHTRSFWLRVTDGRGQTASHAFTIRVVQP